MKRNERNKVKSTPNETHTDPHNEPADDHERHISGSINVRGEIETKRPPNLTEEHNSEREEDTARDQKKYVVEFITLIVLGIYTLATGYQACLTREAINNNTHQFEIDQRPYVWDSNATHPEDVRIIAGQKFWMNIFLINFGKSPALKLRGIAKVFIGDDALDNADRWFAANGEKALPDNPQDAGIVVPPGLPSGERGAKSAFSGGGFFTVLSDNVLTQDNVNYILSTNEKIAIVVHTEYFDAYGKRYWSNLCLSRYNSGAYPHCSKHNEMR